MIFHEVSKTVMDLHKIRKGDFDAIDKRLKEKLSDLLGEVIDAVIDPTPLEKV